MRKPAHIPRKLLLTLAAEWNTVFHLQEDGVSVSIGTLHARCPYVMLILCASLVMFLTDQTSIKEVLLFPALKPQESALVAPPLQGEKATAPQGDAPAPEPRA